MVEAITGQVKNNAGQTLERIKETHPEVSPNWRKYRFGSTAGGRDAATKGSNFCAWIQVFSREGFEYLREGDGGFEFFRGRETAPKGSNFTRLQNHKKILKHVGKKVRLPDGPPPNYLRRPSIYGCVR